MRFATICLKVPSAIRATVVRTRRKFVIGGLMFALNERSRTGRLAKIDDKVEATLTTLAQSQPPGGRKCWTLQLLTSRLVALTDLDRLSYEAVRLALKRQSQAADTPEMVYSHRHRGRVRLADGRHP